MNPRRGRQSVPDFDQDPGWFANNWKWLLAALCGGILLMLVIVGLLLNKLFGLIKSTEPYQHAVDLAVHDAQTQHLLGAPVNPGWTVTGDINLNQDGSRDARLTIPVEGGLHDGTLSVVARESAGKWSYTILILHVDNSAGEVDFLSKENKTRSKN